MTEPHEVLPDGAPSADARHRAAEASELPRAIVWTRQALDRRSAAERDLAELHARAQAAQAEREREEQRAQALTERIRALQERVRHAAYEAQMADAQLNEFRDKRILREAREAAARPVPAPTRGDRAAVAREHELARMKAKLLNGDTAGSELAERLRFAHRQSGKLSLEALGSAVGYSKATLSKVFNGKMAPTWALVRKLSVELKVPPSLVSQEWLPLWIAADMHRQRKPAATRDIDALALTATNTAPVSPDGHICSKCGGWVVDVARHADWHMTMEPGGQAPAAESMQQHWNSRSHELTLLREALGEDSQAT